MNGQIVLNINGNNVTVIGGSYREKPESVAGVKLAEEIDLPCKIDLPIADFSIPTVKAAQGALAKTIAHFRNDNILYVGCMGGFGRTGVFLSLLTRFAAEQRWASGLVFGEGGADRYYNPVGWVRDNYHNHAVETNQQYEFINEFDFRLLLAVAKFL